MKNLLLNMKRLLLLLPLFLATCAKEENAYGWEDLEHHRKNIVVGKMTRDDVLKLLGTPTATDTSLIKEWYYVQLIEEGFSIAKPKVKVHKMLRIIFNDKGIVKSATVENIKESGQKIITEKTKTVGYQEGFFKDTFGRVGQK
jgi:outer membrane protein assembly factor BamE (lipoprotein component of BamABCDE complex)